MRTLKRCLSLPFAAIALSAGCGGDAPDSTPSMDNASGASGQPVIAIAVDADRDGVADPAGAGDRAHRNEWNDKFGASFLANLDDDDGDGVRDADDDVVNGDADLADLARIAVAAWPDAPEGAVGKLSIDAASASAVRIFKKGSAADGAWVEIAGSIGPCASPTAPCAEQRTEASLSTEEVRAGIELGIEARRFVMSAEDAWQGKVDLSYRILDGEGGQPFTSAGAPDGVDHATMRVAPWVLFGNLSPFDTVWASDNYGGFSQGIAAAAAEAGVAFHPIKDWPGDQWTQDFFQTAWTAMPGRGGSVQGMRVANPRPWGRDFGVDATLPIAWLKKSYLGQDRGIIEIYRQAWSGSTFDSHGNHELLPPYENRAKNQRFPLGRIITGSNLLPETGAFYDAQGVQGPHLVVKTDWLYVGHVDEFMSFVPAATPRGWKVLVASPRLARKMLETAQANGNGAVHMFIGKKRYDGNSNVPTSAEESIDDVLADQNLMGWSEEAQAEIDGVVAQVKDEVGLADDEVIEIPVLFEDLFGYKSAWMPGMVNILALGSVVAAPDPFGPRINGVDAWRQGLLDRLATSANALGADGRGLDVSFIDDWDEYHTRNGDVHCGSNAEAGPPFSSVKWWEAGR